MQLDGSPHKWFEDRADPCTLVAFIDDATSRIMDGEFVDYEGTFTLFGAAEHYLKTHGKPLSLYVDRHSTFKINRQATIEEELKDSKKIIGLLGSKLLKVEKFDLLEKNLKRSLISIKKEKPTTKDFPRKAGEAKRIPII